MTKKQKAEIADRLESLRLSRGESSREFAAHCGMKSETHYQTAIENLREGRGDRMSVAFFLAVSDYTGASLDWILKGLDQAALADRPVDDAVYPSRGVAIGVHRLMGTPEAVLIEVQQIDSFDSDPGFQDWLDEIRVRLNRYQHRAR